MTGALSDSNAYRKDGRNLPQHQAALTLLQGLLSNPQITSFEWLDLACGRGQILCCLNDNLSVQARGKLRYVGYDVRDEYTRETSRTARDLGLNAHSVKVGELGDFSKVVGAEKIFDFITLTNTVHEVGSQQLAEILVECVLRLSDAGCLFIYDMETIKPFELGAVPWTTEEARSIICTVATSLGAKNYEPEVGRWNHNSCDAWNIQLQRAHLGVGRAELIEHRGIAIDTTASQIRTLLLRKHGQTKRALESLTRYGAETQAERDDKERLLFDFWALSRALEAIR